MNILLVHLNSYAFRNIYELNLCKYFQVIYFYNVIIQQRSVLECWYDAKLCARVVTAKLKLAAFALHVHYRIAMHQLVFQLGSTPVLPPSPAPSRRRSMLPSNPRTPYKTTPPLSENLVTINSLFTSSENHTMLCEHKKAIRNARIVTFSQ